MLMQIESFAIGSRIRIIHGQLDGATGVVNLISDDKLKCYLKIDGLPDGVLMAISSDMLTMNVGVTSDPMASGMAVAVP